MFTLHDGPKHDTEFIITECYKKHKMLYEEKGWKEVISPKIIQTTLCLKFLWGEDPELPSNSEEG